MPAARKSGQVLFIMRSFHESALRQPSPVQRARSSELLSPALVAIGRGKKGSFPRQKTAASLGRFFTYQSMFGLSIALVRRRVRALFSRPCERRPASACAACRPVVGDRSRQVLTGHAGAERSNTARGGFDFDLRRVRWSVDNDDGLAGEKELDDRIFRSSPVGACSSHELELRRAVHAPAVDVR